MLPEEVLAPIRAENAGFKAEWEEMRPPEQRLWAFCTRVASHTQSKTGRVV